MGLTVAEWVTVAVGIFNAIVVPGAIFVLKAMIEKAADERVAGVRKALTEHEAHDERRFKDLADQYSKTETVRDSQHIENQKILTKLSTDFDWLKSAILHHE
jgi:hypothetical protein